MRIEELINKLKNSYLDEAESSELLGLLLKERAPLGRVVSAPHERDLGTLLDVAGEIEQRKEYADAWRINMLRAQRERDEAYDYLAALWKNGQLPAPMPETLRVNLSLHNASDEPRAKRVGSG